MAQNKSKRNALLTLVLSSFLLLSACGGQGSGDGGSSSAEASSFVPGSEISIANPNGKLYVGNVSTPAADLPIYAAKGKGDVPYADVKFLESFLSSVGLDGINVKVEGKAATLECSSVKGASAVFDAAKNEIRLNKYSTVYGSASTNNGFGFDYCKPKNRQAVIASTKTKLAVAGNETVTIKLNDYGLKLYEQGGKIYAPLDLLPLVTYSNSHYNFVYNGKDYFKAPQDYNYPTIPTYCYSGNGFFYQGFRSGGETYGSGFKKVEPQQNEKYRYASLDNGGGVTDVCHFSFYNDGTGKVFEKVNHQEREREIDGRIWRFIYEEEGDTLTLYVLECMPGSGDDVKADKQSYSTVFKINTGNTHVGLTERSQEMADYTYGLLCLNFDHFYGNKEFVTKGNFDAFLDGQGLKQRLKSKTIATYSEAMGEFLFKTVGDGHTGVTALSSYELPNTLTTGRYADTYMSERVKRIQSRRNELMSKRYEGIHHHPGFAYAEISGDTAMVSFDRFESDGMPGYFRNYKGIDSEVSIQQDSCGYLAGAIMDIEEYNANPQTKTKVQNVVVDLACNEGGKMVCMPYLAGIMTADPTFYVKEVTSGKVTEYHYECDFDGDGNYGDTYATKFNFYVLVSSASFSCATAFPGMLKGTNVKIIGEKSAGGASPVTFFTDGSGFGYQTSGNDIVCYRDGTELKSVEEGVPVDYELPESLWYNLDALGKKLNELKLK